MQDPDRQLEFVSRFRIFAFVEGASLLVALAGGYADFVEGMTSSRPLWILGVLGVALSTAWLVRGLRADKKK